MSKNCELFINLCNFMKYLLNEILPDQEPSDSVIEAAQDLISAIINYTRKIELDISPVFTNYKTDKDGIPVSCTPDMKNNFFPECVPDKNRIIKKEKCLQVTHSPVKRVSFDNKSLSKGEGKPSSKEKDNVDNEPVDCKIIEIEYILKQGHDDTLTKPCCDLDKCNVDQSSLSVSDISSSSINDSISPPKNKYNYINANKKFGNKRNDVKKTLPNDKIDEKDQKLVTIKDQSKETFVSKNLDNLNSTKYQETEMIFEDNFLQFYFFSDLELNYENSSLLKSNQLKTNSVCYKQTIFDNSSISSSEKAKSLSLIDEDSPPLKNTEDTIPYGFQALNGCVLSKLVKKAYYCWVCDTTVDSYAQLQEHYYYDKLILNGKNYSTVDICKDCLFSAIVPASKIDEVMRYHQQSHESASKSLIHLFDAYSGIVNKSLENNNSLKLKVILEDDRTFMDTVLRLKKHRERNSDSSLFLGICLICKAFFFSTLEWSYHLDEFRHFNLSNIEYFTCTPCCFVILGYNNQNIDKHLSSFLHLSQCCLSKCKQSMSHGGVGVRQKLQ